MPTVPQYIIGRDPSCQLLINNHFVSRNHAALWRNDSGQICITDQGSANGTAIGSPNSYIQSSRLLPMDLVFFSEENPVPGSILIKHFEAWQNSGGTRRHSITLGEVARFQGGEVIIGSSPSADFTLPILGVAAQHLKISCSGHSWSVTDLKGQSQLNSTPLSGEPTPLNSGDKITIGAESVCVTFNGPDLILARQRRGFSVEAREITYTVKDRKTGQPLHLLSDVSFSVLPGELVALMGPSGSGKTTLLDVLSGINAVSNGAVLYDGQPIRAKDDALSSYIGYVPQDDLLYDQLTVTECLTHSTRFRVPDRVATAQIKQKVAAVCNSVGLKGDLQHTIIGSPTNKTLSGGQRKRVNLAMELITDPLVLFLDEPTSGLSSRDTRIVIEALRELATEMCIAVIITIHQPALKIYEMFDKVVFLKNGQLAYFGATSPASLTYFDRLSDEPVRSPDDIMETLELMDSSDLSRTYARSHECRKLVIERSNLIRDLHSNSEGLPSARKPSSWVSQLLQFSTRYALCRLRDWAALLVQLLQGPFIGILLAFTLGSVSPNTPLFLLVFVALWFGTNNTSRELVGERILFRRERRGGARISTMLLSKFVINCLITLIQVFAMVSICVSFLDNLHLPIITGVIICWISSIVGITLGLTISAIARTEVSAIVLTPLVLIPFILLGGLMVRYDRAPDGVQLMMNLAPSRWAYEAATTAEADEYNFTKWQKDYAQAQLKQDHAELTRLKEEEFQHFDKDAAKDKASDRLWRISKCLGILTATTLLLLGTSWLWISKNR